jgi:hypothetical protein
MVSKSIKNRPGVVGAGYAGQVELLEVEHNRKWEEEECPNNKKTLVGATARIAGGPQCCGAS